MIICISVCLLDTYSQKNLNSGAQHLYVLVVQETPGDSDDMVVIRSHVRVHHWRHQTTRTMLHPPGAMKRCVECHKKVSVLNTHRYIYTCIIMGLHLTIILITGYSLD